MAFPVALVVIVGPQASGKSTVASALAATLRQQGERVALVELDQIAAMAQPRSAAEWDEAARVFESVVGQWARVGMSCVIAEGSGSRDEVVRLLEQAPATAVAIAVATTAPFEVALARAQADPTRGISGEHDFLSAVYRAWPQQLDEISSDLILATDRETVEGSVEQIRAAIQSARASALGASDG